MTNNEFSNQFDVLWNNISSNEAPGLNEYEKSVFLTKAQTEMLKNYFNAESNPKKDGFDDSIIRKADFSKLIEVNLGLLVNDQVIVDSPTHKFDPRSLMFTFPKDLFLVINEQIHLVDEDDEGEEKVSGIRQVIPIRFDEYTKFMSKPYKEPLKWQAWRLISTSTSEVSGAAGNTLVEIVIPSRDKNKHLNIEYFVRYLRKPRPIILEDFKATLGENITIEGYNGSEEFYSDNSTNDSWEPCELDPTLHEEILQRAIELAKVAWTGDANTVITAGARSE